MSKAKAKTMACDIDEYGDEVFYPKSQRRALHKDEVVPHIPTLYEQIDMAGMASSNLKPKPR
jgi:hypothetical protein